MLKQLLEENQGINLIIHGFFLNLARFKSTEIIMQRYKLSSQLLKPDFGEVLSCK